MKSKDKPVTAPFAQDPLGHLRRTDVTADGLPYREGQALRQRPDVRSDEVESRNGFTVATSVVGWVSAVVAVVLLVLVVTSIGKGKDVQDSANQIVSDFQKTNGYFDQRADLTAPATARQQLEELQSVLTRLNEVTTADVDQLSGLLPDMSALLEAGQGDAQIAEQVDEIAAILSDSAGSLHSIASDADSTVTDVDAKVDEALSLVQQLNNELTRTTNKLAPIPAQDGLIPPPEGN